MNEYVFLPTASEFASRIHPRFDQFLLKPNSILDCMRAWIISSRFNKEKKMIVSAINKHTLKSRSTSILINDGEYTFLPQTLKLLEDFGWQIVTIPSEWDQCIFIQVK